MTDKNCGNCGFYVEHYINNRGKFITVTGCGHCINANLDLRQSKKHIKEFSACKFWQPKSIHREKQIQSIKNTLTDMSENIKKILFVLRDTEI